MIDAHAHLGYQQSHAIKAEVEEVVSVADKLNLDKICVSGTSPNFFEANRLVNNAMKEYPQKILGYAWINPHYGEKAIKEMEKCIREYGMIGIKLHYADWYPTDSPIVFPVIKKAIDLDIPILFHASGSISQFQSRRPEGGIKALVTLADYFPEAAIMMAHMGSAPSYGGDWVTAVFAAKKHDNLIMDTTSSVIDTGMIEMAVKQVGAERIVYGSDMPLLDPFTQLGKVKTAKISEEEKRLILGDNIARIIHLDK